MRENEERLKLWQERLSRNDTAYAWQEGRMQVREDLYKGSREIRQIVVGEKTFKAEHVRNIVAELIEAQVDSALPAPKVTALRKKDEALAKKIEDMLRNEMDRLPFEAINDMMERTVPIQGGAAFLVEWDNTKRTHWTVGEFNVSAVHPRQIVPQDGVYTGIEDMDYIILKVPQTKAYIKARYGVDLDDETEEEPDVKGTEETAAEDMVTQYVAYYRNDKGGIGLYSWACDRQLDDIDDYQARRLKRCVQCGAVEPQEGDEDPRAEIDGVLEDVLGIEAPKGKRCPVCGGTEWSAGSEEYEELVSDILRSDGTVIPVATQTVSETGAIDPYTGLPIPVIVMQPTKIPYYKPNIYPVILQKNVSVYGQFLGDSDVDKIADQQNTINRVESSIIDKLLKSGSYITLPEDASIKVDAEDMKIIRLRDPQSKSMIDVYDLNGNVASDMAYLAEIYEEARQIIGVTDSFQGRHDPTATSGKAKEFAAAQSAGRLESKRVMKDAAYAALFEAIFKFKLAYADEPRPVVSDDVHGDPVYEEFNRYDFLEQDATGAWCWNDQFLFSCDTSAPLAANRSAMWQETRMNLQTGAFGDPANPKTLILFWTKMEMLHYPGASETKAYLVEELQKQEAAQQAAAQQQQMQALAGQMDPGTVNAVMQQAQRDAMIAAQGR